MRHSSLFLALTSALSLLSGCAGSSSKSSQDASGMDQATQYEESTERRKVNANQGSGPLGSQTNPIKCDGAEGAAAYLAKLKGPNGERTSFTELGSAGVGPFGSLLYGYEVSYPTPGGSKQLQIFFDHDFAGYSEPKAAVGFSIR